MRFIRIFFVAVALTLFSLVASAEPVNINTATAEQLESLQNIGPAKAAAIIAHREEYGPFQSVEDLVKVKGIGEKTLEDIRVNVGVGGVSESEAAALAQ